MDRPIEELIDVYVADPTKWQVVKKEVVPSTARRNRGGTSVQELLRNRDTGEEMVRHTLLRPNGKTRGKTHFRKDWK